MAWGIPGCYRYCKTYRFILGRSADERLCSLQNMDQLVIQQQSFMTHRAIKLHNAKCRSILRVRCGGRLAAKAIIFNKLFLTILMPGFQLMFVLLYFPIVKLPLGSVTLRWATASQG